MSVLVSFAVLASMVIAGTYKNAGAAVKITIEKGRVYRLTHQVNNRYKSSNENVVVVTKKGVIKAKKIGKCIVKVIRKKKIIKSYKINVVKKAVKSKEIILPAGDQTSKPKIPVMAQEPAAALPISPVDVRIITQPTTPFNIKYCFANSPGDMAKWLVSSEASGGEFSKTANYYSNLGYMYVPVATTINMVEVGSSFLYMTFYLENNKRSISFRPISADDVILYGNDAGIQFLLNRYNIITDREENVYQYYDGMKQDIVIGTGIWIKDSILVDGIETECLMNIEKYNSGEESLSKLFVYNGNIVSVSDRYITDKDNEYGLLKKISFTKFDMGVYFYD